MIGDYDIHVIYKISHKNNQYVDEFSRFTILNGKFTLF